MSGTKKVEQGGFLFREGDPPDAMYVVKSGKLAVTKAKQNSEVILAEIGPGSMVGEMAFFDNKPRSASVKALKDAELIALPYKSLHAQFASFPEWAKAIMRTVNEHLRTANIRIKELESGKADGDEYFSPYVMTKLMSILNFVGSRYGKKEADGLVIPAGTLRNYTIQVFQEATNKMQKMTTALTELKLMSVQDLGEGKQRIVIVDPDLLFGFVEWYNEWLFKREDQRAVVPYEHMDTLRGVLHFAAKETADEKGLVKLNLTETLAKAQAEGVNIKPAEIDGMISRGTMSEKITADSAVFSHVQIEELKKLVPFWEIIYKLKSITK